MSAQMKMSEWERKEFEKVPLTVISGYLGYSPSDKLAKDGCTFPWSKLFDNNHSDLEKQLGITSVTPCTVALIGLNRTKISIQLYWFPVVWDVSAGSLILDNVRFRCEYGPVFLISKLFMKLNGSIDWNITDTSQTIPLKFWQPYRDNDDNMSSFTGVVVIRVIAKENGRIIVIDNLTIETNCCKE